MDKKKEQEKPNPGPSKKEGQKQPSETVMNNRPSTVKTTTSASTTTTSSVKTPVATVTGPLSLEHGIPDPTGNRNRINRNERENREDRKTMDLLDRPNSGKSPNGSEKSFTGSLGYDNTKKERHSPLYMFDRRRGASGYHQSYDSYPSSYSSLYTPNLSFGMGNVPPPTYGLQPVDENFFMGKAAQGAQQQMQCDVSGYDGQIQEGPREDT